MNLDLLKVSNDLANHRKPFAVATVVRVQGSSSAKVGSAAIVDGDGKIIAGWIGGGCAESAVRHEALSCIEQQHTRTITLDMTDELLGVGMPCGGIMEVFIEPVLPKPDLLIVGHGRIAETLARLGHLMDFRVTIDDPTANANSFPDADCLITDDFDLTGPEIGPQSFIVIATQHKSDHVWLQRALEQDAAYIALVSSRYRARLVLDYLVALGAPAGKVESIWAPAGVDLGAASPEEIALSVMSQIVAVRRGGSAQSLKAKETTSNPEPATDKVITLCDTEGRA